MSPVLILEISLVGTCICFIILHICCVHQIIRNLRFLMMKETFLSIFSLELAALVQILTVQMDESCEVVKILVLAQSKGLQFKIPYWELKICLLHVFCVPKSERREQ